VDKVKAMVFALAITMLWFAYLFSLVSVFLLIATW